MFSGDFVFQIISWNCLNTVPLRMPYCLFATIQSSIVTFGNHTFLISGKYESKAYPDIYGIRKLVDCPIAT